MKPCTMFLFPQGRMDLVDALARGIAPVSEGLLDIADTCNLCGACDLQCHFYSGLRPLPVMAALKDAVEDYLRLAGDRPASRTIRSSRTSAPSRCGVGFERSRHPDYIC